MIQNEWEIGCPKSSAKVKTILPISIEASGLIAMQPLLALAASR